MSPVRPNCGPRRAPTNTTWVWLRPEESTAYGASADFRWNPGTLLPFDHPEFTKRFDDAVAKYMKITAEANRKRKNPVDLVPWLYNSFDSGIHLPFEKQFCHWIIDFSV